LIFIFDKIRAISQIHDENQDHYHDRQINIFNTLNLPKKTATGLTPAAA
jgi:hypothetical protein